MKTFWGLIIFIIGLNGQLAIGQNDSKEALNLAEEISAKIETANYCNVTEDCATVDFGCPFGCGSYVNRNDVAALKEQALKYRKRYGGACVHRCARPIERTACVNGRCVEVKCELNKEYEPYECRCPEGSTVYIQDKSGSQNKSIMKCIPSEK